VARPGLRRRAWRSPPAPWRPGRPPDPPGGHGARRKAPAQIHLPPCQTAKPGLCSRSSSSPHSTPERSSLRSRQAIRDCSDHSSMKPGDRSARTAHRTPRRRPGGVIDGVGRGACDDPGVALVELHPDRPRDALVDPLHVGVQVVAQRLHRARVDEVRPLAVELALELVLVDRADQPLELLVAGRMIAAAGPRRCRGPSADDPVLDLVDDPIRGGRRSQRPLRSAAPARGAHR